MTEIYLIECDGKIQGRRCTWFAERDMDRMGFSNTVDDVMGGQVEDVRRVWMANTETKSFTDATEAVAEEIVARVINGAELPSGEQFDFVENALGCHRMANLSRMVAA